MWGGRQSSGDIRPTADAPLVSPPVALAIDVFARILAEVGRADDEDLETLWPGLVASPRAGRDAYRVPFLELDDLVVDLHPPAPAQDHVHLLLLLVRVAVRKAIAGRDALVAQTGLLELERLGRQAELQVRRAVEPRAEVLQILLDVPERELRHRARGSLPSSNPYLRTALLATGLSRLALSRWAAVGLRVAAGVRTLEQHRDEPRADLVGGAVAQPLAALALDLLDLRPGVPENLGQIAPALLVDQHTRCRQVHVVTVEAAAGGSCVHVLADARQRGAEQRTL